MPADRLHVSAFVRRLSHQQRLALLVRTKTTPPGPPTSGPAAMALLAPQYDEWRKCS